MILQAAWKSPLVIEGRKICFSSDYSNYTVKQRQAFYQTTDSARVKSLDFFLRYPATLKIKEGTQYRAFTSAKDAEDDVNRAASHPPAATEMTDALDSITEIALEIDYD